MRGRPALRVCLMSTSLRSTCAKAKRTILARSPFTRDSSVTASRRSIGRRSVIPGRSSVHRCPSRLTFRVFFLTANRFPSETAPEFSLCCHGRVRPAKQNILLYPNKKPIPRPHHERRLNVQVPARHFRSQLADLLANRLPNLLADALRLQHRGVRPLAQLDAGSEKRGEQSAREDSAPVVVHLVPEPRRARTVVSLKAAERKRTPVRENDAPPNSLQRTLTVPNVRIIYSSDGSAPLRDPASPLFLLSEFAMQVSPCSLGPGRTRGQWVGDSLSPPKGREVLDLFSRARLMIPQERGSGLYRSWDRRRDIQHPEAQPQITSQVSPLSLAARNSARTPFKSRAFN